MAASLCFGKVGRRPGVHSPATSPDTFTGTVIVLRRGASVTRCPLSRNLCRSATASGSGSANFRRRRGFACPARASCIASSSDSSMKTASSRCPRTNSMTPINWGMPLSSLAMNSTHEPVGGGGVVASRIRTVECRPYATGRIPSARGVPGRERRPEASRAAINRCRLDKVICAPNRFAEPNVEMRSDFVRVLSCGCEGRCPSRSPEYLKKEEDNLNQFCASSWPKYFGGLAPCASGGSAPSARDIPDCR
jgi:hypothetical protein